MGFAHPENYKSYMAANKEILVSVELGISPTVFCRQKKKRNSSQTLHAKLTLTHLSAPISSATYIAP